MSLLSSRGWLQPWAVILCLIVQYLGWRLEVGGDTLRLRSVFFWPFLLNPLFLFAWSPCQNLLWFVCVKQQLKHNFVTLPVFWACLKAGCCDISMLFKLDSTSSDPNCFQGSATPLLLPAISQACDTREVLSHHSLQDLVLTAVYPQHVYYSILSPPSSLYLGLACRTDCWCVIVHLHCTDWRCRRLHSSHCFIAKSLIHFTSKCQTGFWKPYSQIQAFTHINKLPYAMGVLPCLFNEYKSVTSQSHC